MYDILFFIAVLGIKCRAFGKRSASEPSPQSTCNILNVKPASLFVCFEYRTFLSFP
jgi:hypothetical protein